jgi:two-component sensor histidine kinase
MPGVSPIEAPDFQAIFGVLPGLYLLLSPDLRILTASRAYLDATGVGEEIVGRDIFEIFPDSAANQQRGAAALRRSFARVLAARATDAMAIQRYDLVRSDGAAEVRYWSPINTPVFDGEGGLRWILHRVSDVTPAVVGGAAPDPRVAELESELYRSGQRLAAANEALADSAARLRLALSAGGMAVWQYRIREARLAATPDLNRLLGLPEEHPTAVDEVRAGFVDAVDPVRTAASEALRAGEAVFENDFRYRRHADGEVRWLRLRAEILRDRDGRPDQVLGVAEDVTEHVVVQERQRTLLNELNHRVKNNLAIVQAVALRTFRGRGCDDAVAQFVDRLVALGGVHDVLTRSHWDRAPVRDVIESGLAGVGCPPERRVLRGPEVGLGASAVLDLSLAVHELATNATKYGALSTDAGVVEVSWSAAAAEQVEIVWRERGGPPVRPPQRRGFGSELLSRLFRRAGASVELRYPPRGVVCRMRLPLG